MSQTSSEPELRKTGEPTYRLEQHTELYDIRAYDAYIVAEVQVSGPAEAASRDGFSLLAAYIFGKNRGEQKLAMTAPVTQTPVTRAKPAPVTQTAGENGFIVHFVMPPDRTLATLPIPDDARVTLREVPARRVAVLRYSGRWTEETYAEHLAELRSALQRANVTTHGAPTLARFNAPYVLPFLRRNEIWLTLRDK